MGNVDFRYDRLDLKSSSFRLVRLFKGARGDYIRCELIYTTLDDNVIPYEAVSYTWGTPVKPLSITLHGHIFPVTRNLWHLLKRIRQPHEDRYLWIDAIAINQDDDLERGHQVQRMRSIYNGAERVIFYLGEETALTEVVMQSLLALQRHVSGSQWAPEDKRWKTAWEKTQCELQPDHNSVILKDTQQQGLKEILKRPWFRRVWVLQEVANARRALVCCGAASVQAQVFAIAPALLDVELDSYATGVFELFPRYSGKSSRKPRYGDFCSILLDFRQSEASDPRDKIFALLGLCEDQDIVHKIVPDYTQTEADVIRATMTCITGGVNIERSVANVEEFLSDNFLSGLVRHSTTDAAISFLIHILSSCKVEAVRHFLEGESIKLTQEAVSAAASNKYNPAEMMIFLLRLGGLGESFSMASNKIEWGYACINLVKKLEATIEMAAWSLGEVVLSVQQKELYPLLFLASKRSLRGIILQLKGEDIGTSELLRKLRQTVNQEGQNDLQQDIQDDVREDMDDQPPRISTAINRKEIIRVLLENHGNTAERTGNWMHLFMAVLCREIEIVELLLETNPGEFDTPCREANLALGYAMDQDWGWPIVFCLLSKGVKLTLLKPTGAPRVEWLPDPLSLALRRWDGYIVDIFRSYPENIVASSSGDFSEVRPVPPLHFAAEHVCPLLLEFLLEQGARPTYEALQAVKDAETTYFRVAPKSLGARDGWVFQRDIGRCIRLLLSHGKGVTLEHTQAYPEDCVVRTLGGALSDC